MLFNTLMTQKIVLCLTTWIPTQWRSQNFLNEKTKLTNIWYYMLYRHVLYKEINLKYIYQLKLSKINLRILLK